MTAFASYTDATCLEHFPTVHLTRFSLTQALTCGVKTVISTNRASSSIVSVPETNSILPNGQLKIGINLPLLARRFRYLRLVGEGTSAQVILAEDTHSHKRKLVVIKILKRHFAAAGHKELRALRFLHNREAAWQSGLVRLLSGFTHTGHVCLVLERLHGSLLDYVVHSARLHPSEALHDLRKIATQLLGCLALMHSKGVVHADIKPENILLTSPPESGNVGVKLIDLGNCFSPTGTDTSRISFEMQTLPFRAPEALTGGACGTGIDVWSLGCVLAEVALQRPLFPITTTSELMHQMTAQLGPLPLSMRSHSPAQASAPPASTAQASPIMGLQQTLGELARGAVQTPGVVRAWNGVTRLLETMTPGSEVRPPVPSLSEALLAVGLPQRPLTTHHPQLALPSAQLSPPVIAQHQQHLDQQQQQHRHRASQQKVSTEAAVIEQEEGQPGEGRANLPSWISPKPEQDHSSQQESHVSPSHVSQSPDSSSSHGLAASVQSGAGYSTIAADSRQA
ncbi:hypothetical protein WJX82_000227 [Trebouxia sp. C0006]